MADQLVELRLSLQRAEVGSRLPSRSVFTIPEEEGENYGAAAAVATLGSKVRKVSANKWERTDVTADPWSLKCRLYAKMH